MLMETKIDIHLINKVIKTTSIETLFYFYRIIVFILKLITKKPPPLAMVHFLSCMRRKRLIAAGIK
ncbi:hypothetical protein AWF80_030125 [Escherichia coli]|nr:hypothetical protein AWF80_030125 [Escherichia coli]TRY34496.1 hypothetical protein FNJ78_29975 [Escherichia coli]